ncbi:hypothetical protein EX30DRAFT_375256 [Ascodesmis nigricans]|uniref:Uncharacterized protein n=1 Tax=Ascodesmis nigricans TaxID=341454 RepID=A0A4S2MQC3_9PEZI|nr:hypothetical protein EX30DRAFT_375256 [Ascodesmis nigricans]
MSSPLPSPGATAHTGLDNNNNNPHRLNVNLEHKNPHPNLDNTLDFNRYWNGDGFGFGGGFHNDDYDFPNIDPNELLTQHHLLHYVFEIEDREGEDQDVDEDDEDDEDVQGVRRGLGDAQDNNDNHINDNYNNSRAHNARSPQGIVILHPPAPRAWDRDREAHPHSNRNRNRNNIEYNYERDYLDLYLRILFHMLRHLYQHLGGLLVVRYPLLAAVVGTVMLVYAGVWEGVVGGIMEVERSVMGLMGGIGREEMAMGVGVVVVVGVFVGGVLVVVRRAVRNLEG